jgi:hypothetical protein
MPPKWTDEQWEKEAVSEPVVAMYAGRQGAEATGRL